ncbi:hypothetical protein DPMN_126889 [Dreissena polymorpha]|uniref:Uncharacterized protein n=1 Tax=Dreissena polymorpha TaxID=45954 RepID=A0A9D4GY61_DREPO|nr:hypothetical protein DPMN_126889 [Dreissena polymorpha]
MMLSSSRFVMDQHDSLELSKTAGLASWILKENAGRSKTYQDRHGATRFTCRIGPYMNRVDPASVWDKA